jgi:hypothetical protein
MQADCRQGIDTAGPNSIRPYQLSSRDDSGCRSRRPRKGIVRVLRHRQGAVRCLPNAALNCGSGRYNWATQEIRTPGLVPKVARGKRCLLGQCLVSARSTRAVQAHCRRCVRRAGLRTSLASCVRSDARRRQSKSCFRRLSDIARRLALLMRYRCTALHGLSVAYATQELKKTGCAYPTTCGLPRCAPIDRSFRTRRTLCLGRRRTRCRRILSTIVRSRAARSLMSHQCSRRATIRECRVCDQSFSKRRDR